MAKSLARGLVTMASVTLVLVGCKSKPAPVAPPVDAIPRATVDAAVSVAIADPAEIPAPDASVPVAATAPTWRSNEHVTSRDGGITLDYPGNVFKTATPKNGSVTLISTISEPSLSGKPGDDIVYGLTLAKLTKSPLDAVKKHLPPGFSDSIPTRDGTVDAYAGVNGARGYTLTQSVEGLGATYVIVTTHDGQAWELTCDFCCGMVDKPKMTASDQIALCEDVLHVFEAAH